MTIVDYKRKALNLLDDYLGGKVSREAVWQWAQEVIVSNEWSQLPSDFQDDIHEIWLLHDAEGSWVPDAKKLREIRGRLGDSGGNSGDT
jgi:hypothetical protein